MSEIKSIDGLYHALGDSGLLTDYRSDRTKVILYLQAAVRESGLVSGADQGSAGYRSRRRGRQKRPLLLRAKVLGRHKKTENAFLSRFQLQMGTVGPHANVPDEKPLFQALFRDGPSHQ